MLSATLPEKSRLLAFTNTIPILGEVQNINDPTSSILYINGDNKGNYGYIRDVIQKHIENGISIIAFPEKTKEKTSSDDIAEFRSGLFSIAKELNIPIVPLFINWPTSFPMFIQGIQQPSTTLGTPIYVNDIEKAKDNARYQVELMLSFQYLSQNN